MLGRFADRAKTVAGLLIVLLAVGTALPAAIHGGAADDPYCDPARPGGSHDRWSPGAGGGHAEHCDVCHWLRGVRSFDAAPLPSPDAPSLHLDDPRPLPRAHARPGRAAAPTRAPPA
jgi:hypothetical protein